MGVLEREGNWTRVVCSNGWAAWVDGRDLLPLTPAPAAVLPAPTPPPPAAAHGRPARPSPAALTGAGVIAVSAFLGWIQSNELSLTGLGIPLLTLIDFKASKSVVRLGYLVLGLAGAGVAGALRPNLAWLKPAAGAGAIVVSVLFAVQLSRLTSSLAAGSVLSVVGLGPPLSFVGGLVLLAEHRLTRRR